jgi:hypothetical protein
MSLAGYAKESLVFFISGINKNLVVIGGLHAKIAPDKHQNQNYTQ